MQNLNYLLNIQVNIKYLLASRFYIGGLGQPLPQDWKK